MKLLKPEHIPAGTTYPAALERLVERGLVHFEPWFVLDGEQARLMLEGIASRYPGVPLLPFAKREDNDDVACFHGEAGAVVVVHDFASDAWSRRREFDSLYEWLRVAMEDMIEYDMQEDLG